MILRHTNIGLKLMVPNMNGRKKRAGEDIEICHVIQGTNRNKFTIV